MRARGVLVAVVVGGVLGLSGGCSSPDPDPLASTPVSDSPVEQSGSRSDAGQDPDWVVDEVSEVDAEAGRVLAIGALGLFVQRDLSPAQWLAQLSPWLSVDAVAAFEGTEPSQVPASVVVDEGLVLAGVDGTSMAVLVMTDVGQYRVELVRQSVMDEWLVDGIRPPEDVSS